MKSLFILAIPSLLLSMEIQSTLWLEEGSEFESLYEAEFVKNSSCRESLLEANPHLTPGLVYEEKKILKIPSDSTCVVKSKESKVLENLAKKESERPEEVLRNVLILEEVGDSGNFWFKGTTHSTVLNGKNKSNLSSIQLVAERHVNFELGAQYTVNFWQLGIETRYQYFDFDKPNNFALENNETSIFDSLFTALNTRSFINWGTKLGYGQALFHEQRSQTIRLNKENSIIAGLTFGAWLYQTANFRTFFEMYGGRRFTTSDSTEKNEGSNFLRPTLKTRYKIGTTDLLIDVYHEFSSGESKNFEQDLNQTGLSFGLSFPF
jgi:hypothetical protein